MFGGNADFEAFLESLAKSKERYPFRLYGYCLMSNHFHLLLRPERGQSISRILQSLTVAHTWRYHQRHRTVGHVWQGRFKSPVVQDDYHLLTVLRYIEANPYRAGIVADVGEYHWSSYSYHGLGQSNELLSPLPEWEEFGGKAAVERRRWRELVHRPMRERELAALRRSVVSGRPFAEERWVEQIARALGLSLSPRPRGRPPKR